MKYPSLEDFFKYCEAADKADPIDRNQSKLMDFLPKMPVANLRLRGNMNTRKTAISSWSWDIVPFDKADLELAQKTKLRLSPVINKVLKNYTDAVFYGTFLMGLKWDLVDGQNIPSPLKLYGPSEVENWDRITVAVVDPKDNKKSQIAIDDTNYLQYCDGEIYRGGLLRSIAPIEIMRELNLREWVNYNRKLKGMIQGIEKGAQPEEVEAAESAMKGMLSNNYMITSDLFEFVFNNTASPGASVSFDTFISGANNGISIAILGQANTTELPRSAGSRAALQVQQMISSDLMYSDVLNVEEIINSQLIPKDIVMNKGIDAGSPRYKFEVNLEEMADYESNVVVVREAVGAGVPLKKSEVYHKIGFTPPAEGDEIVELNSLT